MRTVIRLLFVDAPRKVTTRSILSSGIAYDGMYNIEYTIPPAGHFSVFESSLELTAEQALLFAKATVAETYFSDYKNREFKKVAKLLSDLLNSAYPQYVHPVGVILRITKI